MVLAELGFPDIIGFVLSLKSNNQNSKDLLDAKKMKSQQLKVRRVNRWQTLIAALLDAGAEIKSESGILDKVFSSWALLAVTTDRVERI